MQTLFPASSASSSVSSLSKAIRRLSFSECVELIQNNSCQKFLSRFTSNYIPSCHLSRIALPLDSEADLIEMMTKVSGNTLATYSNDDSTDAESIVGMSFSASTPLISERRHFSMHFNVQYFGTALDDLMKHMEAQLRYAATVHSNHNILYDMGFPVTFDSSIISQQFLGNLVPCGKLFSTIRSVLVTENVQRLRRQL